MPEREIGWLIEKHINSELRYWDGRFTDDRAFTTNHSEAVRFARQEDASIVLGWLLGGIGRVAQHGWDRSDDKSNPDTAPE